MEWNDVVFTDKFQTPWERLLNCCTMHRHSGRAPGIMQSELLPWTACTSYQSSIQSVLSTLAPLLTRDTPIVVTPDQLWKYLETKWRLLYFKDTSKASLIQYRGV
ncbi:hypothetical protein TNCV_354811 [Trichonephila clavipes]|uniref:Uncharacterized protein n=1 Tax=Trichonephila clavipes TaxID=2585209 RepID=A0A8X6W0V5_TRICX|nr:hypothetical protein TNCV_354811 [Trichonephila clavipes]